MTDKKQVIGILKSNGIKKDAGTYHAYEKAKRIIFGGRMIDRGDYNKRISIIAEYVGV